MIRGASAVVGAVLVVPVSGAADAAAPSVYAAIENRSGGVPIITSLPRSKCSRPRALLLLSKASACDSLSNTDFVSMVSSFAEDDISTKVRLGVKGCRRGCNGDGGALA